MLIHSEVTQMMLGKDSFLYYVQIELQLFFKKITPLSFGLEFDKIKISKTKVG